MHSSGSDPKNSIKASKTQSTSIFDTINLLENKTKVDNKNDKYRKSQTFLAQLNTKNSHSVAAR